MAGTPTRGVPFTWPFKMVDATDFATAEEGLVSTGPTITVEISKDGGAFVAADNSAVEVSDGWYEILFTATEMTADRVIFKATATGAAQTDENYLLDTDVVDRVWDEAIADHLTAGSTGKALSDAQAAGDPLTSQVPGTFAAGTAGAALGRIGTGLVATTAPVTESDNIEIVRGDDFKAADNRALEFTTSEEATWPDLTGATIAFTAKQNQDTIAKAGSVIVATGATKKVRIELDPADTANDPIGEYRFDVQATLASGNIVTLVTGKLTLQEDVT